MESLFTLFKSYPKVKVSASEIVVGDIYKHDHSTKYIACYVGEKCIVSRSGGSFYVTYRSTSEAYILDSIEVSEELRQKAIKWGEDSGYIK